MIIINGRFLTQHITGVQRFAYEILFELDKFAKKDEICIYVPSNHSCNFKLNNINIKKIGKLKGHMWEQLELPLCVKKNDVLLNLCSTAPVFRTGIVTIHDISPVINKSFFNWKFRLWYKTVYWIITKSSKKIITVSKFSKSEIIKYYNVKSEKVEVVYNGWQHLKKVKSNEEILEKLNLNTKSFYLGVSSLNPNKNFDYIIRLAKKCPEKKFVVVGKMNSSVFGEVNLEKEDLNNLIFTGYLTDEELKALYENAKLFIFPSFYEGFGIPPLEALASGTDVLISNTSCLPEIFGESANYLNPNGDLINLENIEKFDKREILEKYSWEKSARITKEIVGEINAN